MDIQKQIVDILAEATGEDFSDNMDQELYESGIMDSMTTVQMLLTLQETFDITVPVSEFNRDDWNTPNKLVEQVKKLQDEEYDKPLAELWASHLRGALADGDLIPALGADLLKGQPFPGRRFADHDCLQGQGHAAEGL